MLGLRGGGGCCKKEPAFLIIAHFYGHPNIVCVEILTYIFKHHEEKRKKAKPANRAISDDDRSKVKVKVTTRSTSFQGFVTYK